MCSVYTVYKNLYMYMNIYIVYLCEYMYVGVWPMCAYGYQRLISHIVLSLSYLCFKTESLIKSEIHQLARLIPQGYSCLCLPCLHTSVFHGDVGNPNSGPKACIANTSHWAFSPVPISPTLKDYFHQTPRELKFEMETYISKKKKRLNMRTEDIYIAVTKKKKCHAIKVTE